VAAELPEPAAPTPAQAQPQAVPPDRDRPAAPSGKGPVANAASQIQAALKASGKAAPRILLVEDNPANMRVTQALLEILGANVTQARNGLEAVDAFRNGIFDLVLMDCQMPEMDGYEATRAIRQYETAINRSTPIVALTAHAMAGSREASLEAGMDDQLTKPLTMVALTGKLLEFLVPAGKEPADAGVAN
jgi:CheY-like chemotaxis protein